MNRIEKNRSYHVLPGTPLPWMILFRDFLFTLLAWSVLAFVSWDFLVNLTTGILHEFDADPLNDLDWDAFTRKLKISMLFSSTVLVFICGWAIYNITSLALTRHLAGVLPESLPLEEEVQAYGCTADEVEVWRQKRCYGYRWMIREKSCPAVMDRSAANDISIISNLHAVTAHRCPIFGQA